MLCGATVTRAARNAERLALCDPAAVPRFAAALGRVLGYGEDAYFERRPWRTAEQQAEKVAAGFSQTLHSAHCYTRGCDPSTPGVFVEHRCEPYIFPDGTIQPGPCGAVPASRALHIIGGVPGLGGLYDLPAMFWLHVGAAALLEGLTWGGLYPPKGRDPERQDYFDRSVRPELRSALLGERWHEAEIIFENARQLGAAWDPAHIEWRPA